MSDFDGLFTESLLCYLRTTTPTQWDKIDRNKNHYFSTASLSALLADMEAQVGVHPPRQVVSDTHLDTLGNWVGSVTLVELKSRIDALVAEHDRLANSTLSSDMVNAWSLGVAVRERSIDLTYLGVYLYGIGVSDGLYRPADE